MVPVAEKTTSVVAPGTTALTVVPARSDVQLLATAPLDEADQTVLFVVPVPFQ